MLTGMEKIVLEYPKLLERIESRDDPQNEKKKALKNLKEIRAEFSDSWISSFEKFLDISFSKLYDDIQFNSGGVDFPKLIKDKHVVLVPNHQSHADYVAMGYVCYKEFRQALYVAGGDNLNIFPIGKVFRKSGCFFIRRSFQSDITYKLTLEAYLYYLLLKKRPIEFFFEGGRSRTGKLLPPRYGLFSMLLEAHSQLPPDKKDELCFLPVSIAHENVPEQKSLAREVKGGTKKKESARQLLSLFKLISKQFGTVHISLGKPILFEKKPEADAKHEVQQLAFTCFREVGANMPLTPSSLLSLILLDESVGAVKWSDILARATAIIEYCKKFDVPFVKSLDPAALEETLGRALDIFIANEKVDIIGKSSRGHIFYSIKQECRAEMLYFKNTILHHFLIPWTINSAWINLFNGSINSVDDLKNHLLNERRHLRHEFYLPTVKQFFFRTFRIISDAIGRKVNSLEDCTSLSHKELYSLATSIGMFSRASTYIIESYYVTAHSLKELSKSGPFKMDAYYKMYQTVFDNEFAINRVIKTKECFSVPMSKTAFKFFEHENVVAFNDGEYMVEDSEKLQTYIDKYFKDLIEYQKFNLRVVV